MGDKQIADLLVISHRTVQYYVQSILAQLQRHDRVELARFVLERGLGSPGRSTLG